MGRLTLEIPDDLFEALKEEALATEAKRALAARLFQKKALSLEQASRLADMPMAEFIKFLGEMGIPVVDLGGEELEREFETARRLTEQSRDEGRG